MTYTQPTVSSLNLADLLRKAEIDFAGATSISGVTNKDGLHCIVVRWSRAAVALVLGSDNVWLIPARHPEDLVTIRDLAELREYIATHGQRQSRQ